jgi:hypothetical protein
VIHPTAPAQKVEFRVAGKGVAYKLPKPAPKQYVGNVTVIWDSEV